jgi:hypothetical protein
MNNSIVCALLFSLTLACETDDGGTTTGAGATSSGGSTVVEGETSAPGTSSTTGGTSTGTDEPTLGSGSGGGPVPFEGGECAGFGPGTCTLTPEGWCADLVALCEAADVGANPKYCAALADACAAADATPCSMCKSAWQQCVRVTDVTSEQCETFAETCSCLADGHDV